MWLYQILLLSFVVGSQCADNGTDCLTKEKSLGVLDFAKESISKAKALLPNCTDDFPSTNSSGCGKKEKAIAFLEIATDLITEAENNYPTCPDPESKPVILPTEKPVILPTEKPVILPTEKPVILPTEKPVILSTEKPVILSTEKPVILSTEKPVIPPTKKPEILPKEKPIDCKDVLQQGNNTSGVYTVWPRSRLSKSKPIKVYCDMDTDGGGWTVIQRRGGFSRIQNFFQDWENYKKGFGDLEEEFWLGNDNINMISNQGNYEVRFDLEDFEGNRKYAVYKTFWIEDEAAKYKIHVSDYKGNAGDSMEYDNNNVFGAKDSPHVKTLQGESCAISRETGWWFNLCNKANINGVPSRDASAYDTRNLYWKEWKVFASLAKADMKLRRI